MNEHRSTIARLRERAEQYLWEHLPAPLQRRRRQEQADALAELERMASAMREIGAELERWRSWATRLVLAERWTRCAAEHDPGSHWRVMLSAFAVAALLVDDLGELERELLERSKAADQFARDPVTGEKMSTAEQQVGLVVRAMLEELIAAKSETTRHYYAPGSPQNTDSTQALLQTWDHQKLAIGRRDLVTSATQTAITIATQRLGPAPRVTSSH